MKKSLLTVLLFVFAGLMWIKTITGTESDTEKYIEYLKETAVQNEESGLYKPNVEIYEELIKYENDIKWYKKLKEIYEYLKKPEDYEDMCRLILKNFPDDEENTMEVLHMYDEEQRATAIMDMYQEILSDELREKDEVKDIYLKYACQYYFETSFFEGYKKEWNGYMLIEEEEGYGYVYSDGTYAFDKNFDEADIFIEDYAAVKNNGEWYFIDKDGDKYINCRQDYERVYSYSEGYAVVVRDGKYGYIDMDGNEYGIKYDYATAMYNGVAAVREGKDWYIINSNFEKINEKSYEDVIVNSADICSRMGKLFVKTDGVYYLIDLEGNRVSDNTFENAKLFAGDGMAAVKNNGKWGFINGEGKVVIDYQYEDADSFSSGFAPVKTDGYYEYIYLDGTVRTDLQMTYAAQLNSEGYAVVTLDKGQRVISFKICHLE